MNANGTLNLLEATRHHCPDATFVFTSTNKVYGDTPNRLPLVELETRLELPADHRYFGGIDTSMTIDDSMHSLFGVSKVAADLMVQEYGRYFDMPTVCFRAGCLTGPEPRRRDAARLPVLPDALHRRRRAVHGLRLRRPPGARQHPQRRPRARLRGLPPRAAAGRGLQHRRRALQQLLDARGDRALRGDRRPRARLDARRRRRAWATTAGGSATCDEFQADYPGLGAASTTCARSCARSTTRTPSAGAPRREALGRHPRPRRGGLDRATRCSGSSPTLDGAGIDHEMLVVDDHSTRRHRRRGGRHRGFGEPGPVRCILSPYSGGFGLTVRAGLEQLRGRRRGDRDGRRLRRPARPRPLPPAARGGLRLRLRLALRARLGGARLPEAQAGRSTGS